MKRFVISLLITVCLGLFVLTPSALAADIANGSKVFGANCAACHTGGGNVVNSAKTLRKSDLEKYDMVSLEAIQAQVQRGKAAMPSFLGRLTPEQIEDVAAYVLDQAEKGW